MDNINSQPRSSSVINCPVCKEPVYQTKAGVAAHLRKHVREGKITAERKVEIEKSLVGKTIV